MKVSTCAVIAIFSAFGLTACSSSLSSMAPSPLPRHFENQVILTADEIAASYHAGDSMECTIELSKNKQSIDARIQGNKILLSNVNFGDDVSTGMVLLDSTTFYAWKDGATTGWKSSLPPTATLHSLSEQARTKGIDIPDISTADGIARSVEDGDDISCVKIQFESSTFMPRESVSFTDITSLTNHFLE